MSKLIKIIILLLMVILAILYLLYFYDYRINTSPSIPKGIYKLETTNKQLKQGDLVEICLSDDLAQYAFERGYISKGSCSNGYAPLIKEILAIPNDYVVINKKGIKVNNVFYNLKSQKLDHQKRALNPQIMNRKINGYLLVGMNSKDSWDSRYFGIIESKDIKGRMQKVISL